jgi:hypothetical protein
LTALLFAALLDVEHHSSTCLPSAMSNVSEAERCPELWFPDGNLVFRAENMLFRVYRGVLANKSTIFADMLAVPQPSADDGETFEGCPVVVLSDSAVDVRRFFGVLHDSECVRAVFLRLAPS